jgi:dipeptidyl aminopeptidase/acylaminoacyl peptidase
MPRRIALCRKRSPARSSASAPAPHELPALLRKAKFNDIKLSPTGEYYAASVPAGRKTSLVVLRRSDRKITASISIPGDRTHVEDFWWVNDERLVISPSEKFGDLEQPQLTGDLYAIDANGGKGELLVGQSLESEGPGTRIQPKRVEPVFAEVIDDLADDDKFVLIAVTPFSNDPFTRVERLNVYTGARSRVASAPIRNARFVTDNSGEVRFARGQDVDLIERLYYRDARGDAWKLINDSSQSGRSEAPLGFAEDDKTAYLLVEQANGPDAVVALDIASGERRELFRDDDVSPTMLLRARGTSEHGGIGMAGQGRPVGVGLMDGLPRKVFFNEKSAVATLYRRLEAAFPRHQVVVTSLTKDAGSALVVASSDRNPGDVYVFDAVKNRAELLLSRQDWLDPERTATSRPIRFKARDGLEIHGYLTAPVGGEAKQAPMVILIHGGPYGIFDAWGFDKDAQILAAHGYAVLQVNYRGSGNRGLAFMEAGRRQWGKAMQDDITDATRWAIAEGIADPERICLYGGSYGGYASLMGAAKEPDLYACAAGYVGAYDLELKYSVGDIRQSGSGETYLREWIGEKGTLASVSPNRLADRIKVPVFLAAGGEDKRTPIEHTEAMEKALRKAGKQVEAVYYPTEGHGFYKPENELEFYGKLLNFLHRNIGGRVPSTSAR